MASLAGHEEEQFYVRLCFPHAATADAFQKRFGGRARVPAPGEDTSVQPTPADNGYQANADPEINFASNAEHSADNSLHTPAQHDESGSPVVSDGAHPAHAQVDVNQLPSFKFADNDSAHPCAIP